MAKKTPHAGLIDLARNLLQKEIAWTEVGISTMLLDRIRDQGTRITERVREDCSNAARYVLAEEAARLRR